MKFNYLVLMALESPIASPFLGTTSDGLSLGFAILMRLSHCSGVAKLGKYSARGFQLKICVPRS